LLNVYGCSLDFAIRSDNLHLAMYPIAIFNQRTRLLIGAG
jgi:hypothetical protein